MGKDIIIACDFQDKMTAIEFLKKFHDANIKPFIKIGMELFYYEGPIIIDSLKKYASHIFLDLKLCDIPNTIKRTLKNISKLDIDMITIHSFGGYEMIAAAAEALSGTKINLLVVTILTSISQDILTNHFCIDKNIDDMAWHFSKIAKENGADGVICSCSAVKKIREVCGNNFLLVTPGIRFADSTKDDHRRAATPEFAKEIGSDYIVAGRLIKNAIDPVKEYLNIKKIFVD